MSYQSAVSAALDGDVEIAIGTLGSFGPAGGLGRPLDHSLLALAVRPLLAPPDGKAAGGARLLGSTAVPISELSDCFGLMTPLLIYIERGRCERRDLGMREQPATIDLLGSASVGQSRKTESDVGNERVIVIDVEINALEVDSGVVVI